MKGNPIFKDGKDFDFALGLTAEESKRSEQVHSKNLVYYKEHKTPDRTLVLGDYGLPQLKPIPLYTGDAPKIDEVFSLAKEAEMLPPPKF